MTNGSSTVVEVFISPYLCASYSKKIRVHCSNREDFQEHLSADFWCLKEDN